MAVDLVAVEPGLVGGVVVSVRLVGLRHGRRSLGDRGTQRGDGRKVSRGNCFRLIACAPDSGKLRSVPRVCFPAREPVRSTARPSMRDWPKYPLPGASGNEHVKLRDWSQAMQGGGARDRIGPRSKEKAAGLRGVPLGVVPGALVVGVVLEHVVKFMCCIVVMYCVFLLCWFMCYLCCVYYSSESSSNISSASSTSNQRNRNPRPQLEPQMTSLENARSTKPD